MNTSIKTPGGVSVSSKSAGSGVAEYMKDRIDQPFWKVPSVTGIIYLGSVIAFAALGDTTKKKWDMYINPNTDDTTLSTIICKCGENTTDQINGSIGGDQPIFAPVLGYLQDKIDLATSESSEFNPEDYKDSSGKTIEPALMEQTILFECLMAIACLQPNYLDSIPNGIDTFNNLAGAMFSTAPDLVDELKTLMTGGDKPEIKVAKASRMIHNHRNLHDKKLGKSRRVEDPNTELASVLSGNMYLNDEGLGED
jgi:hypothetical protein